MVTQEIVFENLDNALHNTDDFVTWSPERIANDMVRACPDVEDEEPETLIPHIKAWLEAQRPRSETELPCFVSVEKSNAEGVLFLTIPEDAKAGERVAIHASLKALRRIAVEIEEVLE